MTATLERVSAGLEVLTLANERLRVRVLVSKGADILELTDLRSGIDLLADSPYGLRDPALQPPAPDSVVGWMDRWSGGWQLLLPNAGSATQHGGVELGFHGEAAVSPWACRLDGDGATLSTTLARSPFRIERRLMLAPGSRTLVVRERVTNVGRDAEHLMWVHHPLVGPPLLEAGCRITTDARTVTVDADVNHPTNPLQPGARGAWPHAPLKGGGTMDLSRVPGPEAGITYTAYLSDFADGWLAVTNPRLDLGIRWDWSADVLPYAWLFAEIHASSGYPWYKRAYVLGVEPASSVPAQGLTRALAEGTALTLAAGESRELEIRATVTGGG